MRELYKDTIAVSRFRIDETVELIAAMYGGIVLLAVFQSLYFLSIYTNDLLIHYLILYSITVK